MSGSKYRVLADFETADFGNAKMRQIFVNPFDDVSASPRRGESGKMDEFSLAITIRSGIIQCIDAAECELRRYGRHGGAAEKGPGTGAM